MALRVQKRGSHPSQRALASGERLIRPSRPETDFEPTAQSPKPPLRRLDVGARDSQEVTAVDVRVESQSTQSVQVLPVLSREEPKQAERTEHTKPLPTIPPPLLDAGELTETKERAAERQESTLVMASAPPKPPPGPDPATLRRVRIVRTVLAVVWLGIVGITLVTLRTMRELKSTAHVVAAQAAKLNTNATAEPSAAPTASAASAEPTTAAPPAPTEAPAPAPAATASEPPAAADSDQGVVVTAQAPSGRRVWIDEHLMTEQTPEPFTVRCGKHHVRIGSSGKSQPVDVPCGGEVAVK